MSRSHRLPAAAGSGPQRAIPTRMPRYDFRTPRLYVADAAGRAAQRSRSTRSQANYLRNVLRLKAGDAVLLFNGRDGEWRAGAGRVPANARLVGRRRADAARRPRPRDLHYLFAPLKHARLDYMVQKAVEMGASRLQPVLTRHTQVGAAQSRAHARQRHRGGGAMRHPDGAGDRRAGRRSTARSPARARPRCWCSATRTPRSRTRSRRSPRTGGADGAPPVAC